VSQHIYVSWEYTAKYLADIKNKRNMGLLFGNHGSHFCAVTGEFAGSGFLPLY
jgi:hypothetical protein